MVKMMAVEIVTYFTDVIYCQSNKATKFSPMQMQMKESSNQPYFKRGQWIYSELPVFKS